MKTHNSLILLIMSAILPLQTTLASGNHAKGVVAEKSQGMHASFDIVRSRITTNQNVATFSMTVAGKAGVIRPVAIGELAGSEVYSYVWPTTMNSDTVGFESDAGILALAVTAHPDFDDTPLYDENGDNDRGNDGKLWHSHWVVLQANDACGKDALGVVDIPEGTHPRLPKTWPQLPLLLDSPGWDPVISGDAVEVKVAFDNISAVESANFDGVTAGLRVNQSVHAPLLCVANVMDIASSDLSLPGIVNK